MPAAGTKPEGAPVWLELVAADPDGAAAFYGGLLGVGLGEPHSGMRMLRLPAGDVALLVPAGPDDTPGWLTYLLASDVDAVVRDAVAAGGEVLVPVTTASPAGRYAVLRDPSGARVGLWEPWDLAGVAVEHEPGAPGWYELHTAARYDETVRFYRDGLGWPASVLGDTDAFRMVVHGEGASAVAGIYDGSITEAGQPSGWQVHFQVADADAAAARIRDLGGTVLDGPVDTPFGRIAHALDPEGGLFAVFTPPSR